ncbi:MAG: hypothetical protein HOD72_03800 [Opitutae bacterium]|jgi:hypothetical protein|nr:hypothetical protein [Opitutae bacterium]MBT5380364.1 hypothetical protein [Opitutae bacterium]MBT5689515.1 hypothetical protein [Opitutae bacterium]MBT6460919.1 hypothetical protein [Opitutae bacterium]MBT6959313.1 hypothetical protein [Opitutae bacterium]
MKSIYLPKEMELLICSYGGVGTTFLIDFLAHYKKCNNRDDQDGFKHLDKPPPTRNPELKTIYIFGKPIDAIYSLFRRGFHNEQSYKLLEQYEKLNPVPIEMSLETYAKEGTDRFHFENHFLNWSERNFQYPVLFVRYEKIWENLDTLLKFAGIPKEKKTSFPQKKERKTQSQEIPDEVHASMQRMYGNFQDQLENSPDCWVFKRQKNASDRIYPLQYATRAKVGMLKVWLKRNILRLMGRKHFNP